MTPFLLLLVFCAASSVVDSKKASACNLVSSLRETTLQCPPKKQIMLNSTTVGFAQFFCALDRCSSDATLNSSHQYYKHVQNRCEGSMSCNISSEVLRRDFAGEFNRCRSTNRETNRNTVTIYYDCVNWIPPTKMTTPTIPNNTKNSSGPSTIHLTTISSASLPNSSVTTSHGNCHPELSTQSSTKETVVTSPNVTLSTIPQRPTTNSTSHSTISSNESTDLASNTTSLPTTNTSKIPDTFPNITTSTSANSTSISMHPGNHPSTSSAKTANAILISSTLGISNDISTPDSNETTAKLIATPSDQYKEQGQKVVIIATLACLLGIAAIIVVLLCLKLKRNSKERYAVSRRVTFVNRRDGTRTTNRQAEPTSQQSPGSPATRKVGVKVSIGTIYSYAWDHLGGPRGASAAIDIEEPVYQHCDSNDGYVYNATTTEEDPDYII